MKAEDHFAMEDDPTDEDYGSSVRKSLRRRKSSMKVLQQIGKRKRGRPPTLTDPVTCSKCGETFVVAKDYKQHCVSKVTLHGRSQNNSSLVRGVTFISSFIFCLFLYVTNLRRQDSESCVGG